MPEDFGSKEEWKENPEENEFESMTGWLKQVLHQDPIDGLEAMRVKYEVKSMEDLVITALLTLLFIEEKEAKGEMIAWFSYAEKHGIPQTLGEKKIVGRITTLEKIMQDACEG